MRGFITSSCSSIVILMRVSARLCSNRSLTLGFHRVSLASVNQRAFRKKRFPHTDADDLRLQLRMHTSVRHLVPKGASVRSSQARLRNWIQMPHMKSQASLINSLPSYLSTELADRDELNSKTGLQTVDWLPAFRNDPANEPVLTAGAMLSNDAKLPPDHIVS